MFTRGLKRTTLASQTYVDNQISANLPTGSVYELTLGDGLSIVGGGTAVTTVGQIKLDSGISGLNDVSGEIPLDNEVLTWDAGTSSWRPATFTGTGSSPLSWDNLTNVQSLTNSAHYIMKVNGDSDEIELIQNQLVYAPDLVAGVGINHTTGYGNNGAILRTDIDLSEVYITTESSSESTLVFVDEDDNQRRIRIGDILLSDFSNNVDPYLQSSGISTVSPVVFDDATTTFYLDNKRFEIDFDIAQNYGISGLLPIESGGTSASNAYDARVNLGVSYNSDVMTYQDPQFIGYMAGTDILVRPQYLSSLGLSVRISGSGYDPGLSASIVLDDGGTFSSSITTGASGDLITVTADNIGGHQDYLNWNIDMTGTVQQGVNESGEVTFEAQTGYINFGQETGENGYGIGYDGQFWFREKEDSQWMDHLPFEIEDASNVEDVMSSNDPGAIMIWNGSEFTFRTVSGDMTLNSNGVASLGTASIDPTQILATHDSSTVEVDQYEFGTLYNINTGMTIQEQIDNGVSVTPPINQGDIIYYDGDSWEVLPYDNGNKVLVSTGISAPSWDYVSTTYVPSTEYVSGDNIMFLDNSSGTSTTLYTTMPDILIEHTGGTGGIAIPTNILSTNIAGLPGVSSFNTSDFVMAVNNPSISTPLDEQIGVSTFISSFVGSGLTTSGNQIILDTATDIVPSVDNIYNLGNASFHWEAVYTKNLYLDVYATTGDAGAATEGRVIYVSNGGDEALGVGDGTIWRKVELGTF